MEGKSTRIGVRQCNECRKPFTVKVGTIFEASHVPMRHWLQAIHLLCSSKKGISSNQLHRILGVTLKTAWFMSHRIREAFRSGDLSPMGGEGDHGREEYGYTDRRTGTKISTNTIEGYYSIFKRGMKGTYQHCAEKHLHRYLAEFDIRYSNRIKLGIDGVARADRALTGASGKRLTYRTLD